MTTLAREVVLSMDGPALDAAKRAHATASRAEAMLHEVTLNAQIARNHLADILVAATNQPAKGLRFDPDTGSVYREVAP